jgi:hypothetical protein
MDLLLLVAGETWAYWFKKLDNSNGRDDQEQSDRSSRIGVTSETIIKWLRRVCIGPNDWAITTG